MFSIAIGIEIDFVANVVVFLDYLSRMAQETSYS